MRDPVTTPVALGWAPADPSRRSGGLVGTMPRHQPKVNIDRVTLGDRHAWDAWVPFVLGTDDRRRHVYAVGKTGTGKTTLLRNLILQDILAGNGVGVIDPHGDLAEDLLDHIPPSRADDLVYFNPTDHDYPVGLNLLRPGCTPDRRHLICSGIVGSFKSIWRDSWGPRLEYLLYAAVAALSECQNVSLLGVPRLLVDARYRHWVLDQVTDPVVRAFWLGEFAGYDKRFLSEVIAPVQNKVGQLLMAAPVRNVLGQVKSKIDARFLMDDGRILIANLSKGRLGADKANLLGALLVTEFQLASMARADVREDARRDFYLYVDEFYHFTTDSFASILSEARKYRLCLTLSHQYTAQLSPEVRDAVFGNAGTLVSFRVGAADAAVLAREFGGEYDARLFTQLSNREVCVHPVTGGESRQPFLATIHPPLSPGRGRRDKLIDRSRQKYATPRPAVENKIRRWMGTA